MWRALVENTWLALHFIYRGKRRKRLFANGVWYERAYSYFMRNIVGNGLYTLTRSRWYYRMASYLNDLYPDLLSSNPFEEPERFVFPYATVTLDHMYLVYQMDERFDLLKIAEERGMMYDKFFDYVINYTYTENDKLTKPKYKLMHYGDAEELAYFSVKGFSYSNRINTPASFVNKAHG